MHDVFGSAKTITLSGFVIQNPFGIPRVMGAIESLDCNSRSNMHHVTESSSNGDLLNTDEVTRHNSADSLPTSNLVCIKEVAIRTTFSIVGRIYYTCNLVTEIQCTRYKNGLNKRF